MSALIGRYEIDDELGEGGMASVYLATDPYMNRKVAIKVLPYLSTTDERLKRYFQREAEFIAALEHPSIVPVFDFGYHGSQPYIVMRHMAGGDMGERLKAGLKLTEVAKIIERVADGLDAAHAKDIIHRDVKPTNILFDAEGKGYLSDFGLAKSVEPDANKSRAYFVGTPAYMSPEQVRSHELDARSDIYALGVVVFQAVTGKVPFKEESPMLTAAAHVIEPVPSVRDYKENLPASWDEILSKALAKDPADRYQRATDLARDVQELVSGRWFFRKLIDD
jgi:serine/threonine protein kinase